MDPQKVAEKIVKIFATEIKSIDDTTKTITAVVSTSKTDRHGDVVAPEAFRKRLKIYKDHPVLLSSHDYYDLRKQIGEAVSLKITDEGLEARFKYYAGEGNQEADWAWVLAQKRIAAFSIGFMRHDFEWLKEKDNDGNERITGRRFTDVELLEISQVLVPANRQSLQERNDYAEETGRLAVMVSKALEDGDIPEQPARDGSVATKTTEESAESTPAEKPADDTERSHYSETILDDGSPREASSQSNKEALEGVVKDAAKSVFQ